MTETRTLLDRLLHGAECYDAFPELETLSAENPAEGAAIAWNYLMRVDPMKSDMGIDAEVVRMFLESNPHDGFERILREWPRMTESQRHAVCRGASNAEAMPESLVVRLFNAEGSDTHERHLLAAGLASTAEARHAEATVLSLVNQIGTYPPEQAHRQATLDRFIDDVRRTFNRAHDSKTGAA